MINSDKSMPKQSASLGIAPKLQRESKSCLLRQVAAVIEEGNRFISKDKRSEKKASRDQVLKLAVLVGDNTECLINLWLCDRISDAAANEPLAEQAFESAIKNITTKA